MSDSTDINLGLELGPVFLAHCLNWALYGLLCLQVYIFYASFPRDTLRTKILVYSLFVVDSISIAMSTYSGYWVFVTNWGQYDVFNNLGWSWATVPASSGIVALIVQAFFAYRIWQISKNWFMPIFIVILSGIACGFAIASAAEVAQLQTFTYIRHRTPSIWLSFGIASDFFVCGTLVFYLLRAPKGFALTNRIVIRLVRIAIETALITIVAAAIKLWLIFSRTDNMHLLFCLLLARLYSNALCGTLNSRSPIFGGNHVTEPDRSSRGLTWSSKYNSSFGSIKKGDGVKKKFDGKILVTSDTLSDCETGVGIVRSYDEDGGQVISYEPTVPTYPLSPMAPSYRTQRPESGKPESAKALLTAVPTPPPSATGVLPQ